MMYSGTISPPFTLSEATRKQLDLGQRYGLSKQQGMLALLAAFTEVEIAAESTGLTKSTLMFVAVNQQYRLLV